MDNDNTIGQQKLNVCESPCISDTAAMLSKNCYQCELFTRERVQ